jgi:hypothetical protein
MGLHSDLPLQLKCISSFWHGNGFPISGNSGVYFILEIIMRQLESYELQHVYGGCGSPCDSKDDGRHDDHDKDRGSKKKDHDDGRHDDGHKDRDHKCGGWGPA